MAIKIAVPSLSWLFPFLLKNLNHWQTNHHYHHQIVRNRRFRYQHFRKSHNHIDRCILSHVFYISMLVCYTWISGSCNLSIPRFRQGLAFATSTQCSALHSEAYNRNHLEMVLPGNTAEIFLLLQLHTTYA